MPTRTRIIFRYPAGEALSGPAAVSRLVAVAAPRGMLGLQFPDNWKQMPKREKLMWLADKLPAGYSLTLFQEPRRTRRSRSIYWRTIVGNDIPVQKKGRHEIPEPF